MTASIGQNPAESSSENNDETDSQGEAILAEIRQRARKAKQTIVLAEPKDDRVLYAADYLLKNKISKVVLLGSQEAILPRAKELSLCLDGAELIDPQRSEHLPMFASKFYERRKHKGITEEEASKTVTDPLFFGASLVRTGICDGMVAGSISPTAHVIRSGLQCIGLQKGIKTVSSFFLMITPKTDLGLNGSFIFSDGGCVPDPNSEQLVDIALASADHCKLLLQTEPFVAFLSFSTQGSAKHPLVEKVRTAVDMFKKLDTGIKADGEFQLDAAIIKEIAERKAPDSQVAGRANVLIFPDLNAGNIGYKLTERLAGARAVGPILQGMDLPVNDLSRGCKWQDIVDVAAVTAIQSQARKIANNSEMKKEDVV